MKLSKRKKAIALAVGALILITALALYTLWANTALTVVEYSVKSDEIPQAFDGFKIAQISDLHNYEFGEGNGELIGALKDISPDIIVITGDMVDSNRTDFQSALEFASNAVKLAPTYYVTGNHEARIGCDELKKMLEECGVCVLENESVTVTRASESITLIGLDDISVYSHADSSHYDLLVRSALLKISDMDGYKILLSHRPEFASEYARCDIDLAFCGHAHGGQFRLPFIGGLYAPGQGFFPKYDKGLYKIEDTVMIVSSGLGNSRIPLRINNRPQLVAVTLECA